MRAPIPVSSVAVEHIHDSCISIQHHMMWDPSVGVDAPRSEPLAALRQFSLQDPGYEFPRIYLLRRWVNRPRWALRKYPLQKSLRSAGEGSSKRGRGGVIERGKVKEDDPGPICHPVARQREIRHVPCHLEACRRAR
jgi:hypothetical protein